MDFEQGYADPNSVICPECCHVGTLAEDHPRFVPLPEPPVAADPRQLVFNPEGLDI